MKLVAIALGACVACGDGNTPDDVRDAPATSCSHQAPWASAPALPRGATQETAAVATGGKLYVLGGFDQSTQIVRAVQIFDPATCTWSLGPELPRPIHHANAAVVDGTIYIAGALETASFVATGEVWAWSPATEAAWSTRTAMPANTQRGAAVTGVIDGKIYVAGGLRGGAAVADVSAFDPVANQWAALPALPQPRDHACGAVIASTLYVAGGRQAAITTPVATVYAYSATGAWTERAAMPTARGGTACGVVGDRLVVVGGEGNRGAPTGVFPEVEAYDPIADAWAALPAMPTPRHGMAAAAVAGRLYVPGGADRQGFGAVATHEVLTP
jgi:N-acetylneuraminic acid mutarotase